jgi:hypothetical protein
VCQFNGPVSLSVVTQSGEVFWIGQIRGADLPACCLHPRAGTRPRRRKRRPHTFLQQRPHRGRQHQDQTDRTPDALTSRLHPASPPHPPRIAERSVTTQRETGPLDLHSPPRAAGTEAATAPERLPLVRVKTRQRRNSPRLPGRSAVHEPDQRDARE